MVETLPFPLRTTTKVLLIPSRTTTKVLLFPQNYDQGIQDFDFSGLFLLTGESILKTKMEEMFVFKSSFIPFRVILE